jgi:tetratricopeptide (TPR) repeat protein
VIPVLIERATMPAAMDLPEDIAALAQRNALELSDVRWESDVQLLIQAIQRACAGPVATAEPPTPQWPELQDVQKRRAREIASHLSNARQAFVARNYEATLLACEKALLLDPQNVEALDLLDLARTTTDEQHIETWLTQARQSLDRGDISSTSDLIDQALALDPNLEPALALRNRVLALRRERERGRERARDAKLVLAEIANKQNLARANARPPNPSTGNSNSAAPAPARPESPATKAAQTQPRAPEPVPTAPGSQPSASDLEKARVAGIVHRYAAGYNALNAAAVSAVYPGDPVWMFPEFDFYTLKVEDLATELSPDGLSATVVCTATHTFKRKRAPAPVTERLRQTFCTGRREKGEGRREN